MRKINSRKPLHLLKETVRQLTKLDLQTARGGDPTDPPETHAGQGNACTSK